MGPGRSPSNQVQMQSGRCRVRRRSPSSRGCGGGATGLKVEQPGAEVEAEWQEAEAAGGH
jgi:hypothetical protein